MNRKQAQLYIEQVSDTYDAPPCVYGHFGCALRDGGPCSNELQAEYGDDGEGNIPDAKEEA